jgi:hypothetical protein
MLYTVMPLERIYSNRNETIPKDKTMIPTEAEYKEISLPHGRIVTRREGDSYIIERINSTDMKDYLCDEYSPGKKYYH